MPSSSTASSAKHLVAVALAFIVSTATVFLPILATAMAATAFLSLALGAEMLQRAHGLESRPFREGYALAFLVLCGAGGWQAVVSIRALLERRAEALSPTVEPENAPDKEVAISKGATAAKEMITPWASLGWILFIIDGIFVKRDVRGQLDLPDAWVAAAILATMGYAIASVCIVGLRVLLSSGRTLWDQARQSQFRAGLIASAGFIFGISGALIMLGFYTAAKAHIDRNPVVISVHEAPRASSAREELRLALAQIVAPSPRLSASSSVPSLGLGPGSTARFPVGSRPFARCIDTFLDKSRDTDFVVAWSLELARRYDLSIFDAKGLVLDTLLSVCRQKADDPGDLSHYFQRSLTLAARNYYKRLRRGQNRQCQFEQVYILSTGEPDDPERDLDLQINARNAYCRLRQRDQGLIHARVVENLSFREIGEEEGLSADTTRVAFNRAMDRLREEVEK